MASIASIARGKAASELAVPKAIVTGSATAFRNVLERHAKYQRDRQQDANDEDDKRSIKRQQQLEQTAQHRQNPVCPTV